MKTPAQIADDASPDFEAMGLNESFRKTMRTWIVAAVEADRAQRAQVPAFNVGDPDPTPDNWEDIEQCEAITADDRYGCTWEAGHSSDRPHVAGDGARIWAVWS